MTVEAYRDALRNVEEANPDPAVRLFELAWERRDEHEEGSQEYDVAVSAGVALAAHMQMSVVDFESEHSTDEILEEVDPEALPEPQEAVYSQINPEWKSDTTLEDIAALAERCEGLGMDETDFEARMFGLMLKALKQ